MLHAPNNFGPASTHSRSTPVWQVASSNGRNLSTFRPPRPECCSCVVMILASVVSLAMTALLRAPQPGVTAFHAMFGLSFAMFWRHGWWALPIILVGQFLSAWILATPWTGLPFVVVSDTIVVLAAVIVLQRLVSDRNPLGRVRDTAWWLLIAVVGASWLGAVATTFAWSMTSAMSLDFVELCLVRWLAAGFAMLLIAPLAWAWLPWRGLRKLRQRVIELLGLSAIVAAVVGYVIVSERLAWRWTIPAIALWVPLFAWVVSRFDRRGTTLLSLVIGLGSLLATAGSGTLPAENVRDSIPPMLLETLLSNLPLFSSALMLSVWWDERSQIDLALSAAEARYRILFENSPDAVFVVAGPEESLRQFNDRLPELLGYPRARLATMRRGDFELGTPMLSMRSSVVSVYSPGTSEFETQYRRADGKVIDVAVTYSVIDYLGETAYLMITRDVTARRLAELQLRESEARFRTLAETIPALVVIQSDERIQYANPAATELVGYSERELRKLDLVELIRSDFQTLLRDQIQHGVLGHISIWRQEVALRSKSGEEKWLDLSIAPITLDSSLAWLACAVETTEQRRREAEIRQLNADLFHTSRLRLLGELAAGIAHRIKHPIGNIGNLIKALTNHREDDSLAKEDELRETLQMIIEEADEANATVSEMIRFARRQEMNRQWTTLEPLIADAARFVRFDRRWSESVIRIDAAHSAPKVFADRAEITQVLIDLFRNGLEAMEDLPRDQQALTVQLRDLQSGWLQLSVTDCGCGVPPERRAKLFQKFETTKPEGLGLGLSLCKTIVEGHGGRLWYEPVMPRGSTFHLLLPTEDRMFDSTAPAAAPLEP